ncbi:MAG: MarC family protein [Candidatus Woesearchaeota archaeon]
MIEQLIQLIILFFVIIDPMLSFAIFMANTKGLSEREKKRTALLAVALAAIISYAFLFIGERILTLFNTPLDNFRIAGGIILGILGTRMALGHTILEIDDIKKNSSKAIAAIIATPLISGPACITAIIISSHDYGMLLTGIAVGIVLGFTGLLLYISAWSEKYINKTAIKVTTTIMGLITLAWGVNFIRIGLGF